jgi:beta-N-acetylhexosaminidase
MLPDSCRPFIFGCAGSALLPEEDAFFRHIKPWGFILFRRNVENQAQLLQLTNQLRETVGRADAPIFIDQEGGRVQRLSAPNWPIYPSGSLYARLYERDEKLGRMAARQTAQLIGEDLIACGINGNCLPIVDVPIQGAHTIIGDRAYGHDPKQVGVLGSEIAAGLEAAGVWPVLKHIPGHGRALVDSHEDLPVVTASQAELIATDFVPFQMLRHLPLAMTAHVVYTAYDDKNPATTSKTVIDHVIRGHIGFQGLLMSDDLSMHALKGSMGERTEAALKAGCDLILHCNGDMAEMQAIAAS